MNTLKKHTQKNAFFLQEVVKQRDETKVKKNVYYTNGSLYRCFLIIITYYYEVDMFFSEMTDGRNFVIWKSIFK